MGSRGRWRTRSQKTKVRNWTGTGHVFTDVEVMQNYKGSRAGAREKEGAQGWIGVLPPQN